LLYATLERARAGRGLLTPPLSTSLR
jgi:hypothetical protein